MCPDSPRGRPLGPAGVTGPGSAVAPGDDGRRGRVPDVPSRPGHGTGRKPSPGPGMVPGLRPLIPTALTGVSQFATDPAAAIEQEEELDVGMIVIQAVEGETRDG